MGGARVTKAMLQERIRRLVAGTKKHAADGSLILGSTTYTTRALVEVLESLGDALDSVDGAKARWQDALEHANDLRATVGPVIRGYQAWVAVTHGGTPSTLADYGVTPPKERTPLTAEQLAIAVAKRNATRAARHTMGKRQRKLTGS
jgi:hypothetical protein